ncbi:MAG: LAGLIDADG endonuclease [Rhabdochlamydiaceae bacterium]
MIPWEDNFDNISKKQEELIIGSLLGDARLESRSLAKTARLRIHHADSQKDYLFWKFQQLRNLVSAGPKKHSYIDKRFSTNVVSWYFHTRTLKSFSTLYCSFYKTGKKVLPKQLSKMLTPFALAVWIMDDGCLSKQSIILNTQNFSFEEHKKLQLLFKYQFSIDVGIHKDRRNFRLYFPTHATKRMQHIIAPFLFGSKFIPVETDPRYLI